MDLVNVREFVTRGCGFESRPKLDGNSEKAMSGKISVLSPNSSNK